MNQNTTDKGQAERLWLACFEFGVNARGDTYGVPFRNVIKAPTQEEAEAVAGIFLRDFYDGDTEPGEERNQDVDAEDEDYDPTNPNPYGEFSYNDAAIECSLSTLVEIKTIDDLLGQMGVVIP